MLTFTKKPTPYRREQQRISQEYSQLTERLTDIRSDFDQVTDSDVIDALIYEENAVLARLSQLYKDARAGGITLDIHENGLFLQHEKNKKI